MTRSYLASCVFVLFASSAVNAIFFGGGGGGGGGGCCQPSCGCGPPPAPPSCSCAAPPPPQQCNCAPPPPQPCSCAPPPPPPPSCSCAPPQPCGYSAPQQSCQPRYIIVRPIESSHISAGPVASGPVGGSYQAGPAISSPVQGSYAAAPAPISAPIQAPASYQAAPEIAPPPPPPADTGSYRGTSYKSKARASKTILLDSRCNSGELRQVLIDNIITDDANESKRRVHKAANEEFTTEESDKGIDVICAPSAFSYRIATDFFCEHTKGNVTCFAYQQHA